MDWMTDKELAKMVEEEVVTEDGHVAEFFGIDVDLNPIYKFKREDLCEKEEDDE